MPKDARPVTQPVAHGFLTLFVFLVFYTMTAPAGAQSFLGTIRGTVVDPQGSVVPGAAVLIVDESTNVPRAVETDAEGRYHFETIVPAVYPGRTRHYHVKVQPKGGRILTTQLYFPGEAGNSRDGLYQRELEMKTPKSGEGKFDFVVSA